MASERRCVNNPNGFVIDRTGRFYYNQAIMYEKNNKSIFMYATVIIILGTLQATACTRTSILTGGVILSDDLEN